MKILLSITLLFFWSSISAQILPEYSGSWYNRDQNGHGLSIEVIDDERTIATIDYCARAITERRHACRQQQRIARHAPGVRMVR